MFLNFLLLASLLVGALGQRDYLDEPLRGPPPRRPAPPRIDPGYSGPAAPRPTPVPILKQINRHNEDGSYTYGYESADGSFKIETKLPTGEVKGKYGFVDDVGKVRVVEYGATKYGFEPSGEGITVAPPTLFDDTTNKDGTLKAEYADEFYEPAPAPKSKYQNYPQDFPPPPPPRNPAPQAFEPAPAPRPRPQPQSLGPPPPRSLGPAPPRASIPGASFSVDFGSPSRGSPPPPRPPPQSFSFQPDPAPIEENSYDRPPPPPRPKVTYARPAPPPPRPQPSFEPSPDYEPLPPRPAPRPAPVTRQSGGGPGILDQLAKDYALPSNGGAPLHDISFGYY